MKKITLVVLLALIFFQCETSSPNNCATPATVRNLAGLDGCGWVFELNDGTRLEPYWQWGWCGTPPLPQGALEDPLYDFEYTEGKQVFISYEEAPGIASICMAGPVVKITCIQEVPSSQEE